MPGHAGRPVIWRDQKTLPAGYLIPQTPGKIGQKPTDRLKKGSLWQKLWDTGGPRPTNRRTPCAPSAGRLAVGVAAVELDVQLTKDGRLAVIHDETLDRTTNGKGRVKDFTLAELQRLDAGRGEPIPSLEEVFDLVQGQAHLVVELKQPEAAGALRRFFQERRAFEFATVVSFWHPAVKALKEAEPRLNTGVLMVGCPADPVGLARAAARRHPGPPVRLRRPRNWWPPPTSRILRSWSGILTIPKS